jgi:glycerophosphoryl diester phosphodiesterase
MLIIAHRGLSAHHPENTLIAFERALQGGANAIECDVRQVDNTFYIFHDDYLKRLTGDEGALKEKNPEQIANLRVASIYPLPTLQDVIRLVAGKVLLNLELKSIADPALFADVLSECINRLESESAQPAYIDIVLSSFNHPMLSNIRSRLRNTRYELSFRYAALIAHLPMDNAQYAVSFGADIAAIDAELVSAAFVKQAHQYNLEVWCYTVNHESVLSRLWGMEVDGIFSDDVIWANDIISKLKNSCSVNA